jgi:hypothetical protein
VPRGAGIEAFGDMQLQPSGRDINISVRGGAEYEWVPGRFRVAGGAYYEPARFRDPLNQNVPGRVHLTAGFEVKLFSFTIWGKRYRVRLALSADVAEKFSNVALSPGFWH